MTPKQVGREVAQCRKRAGLSQNELGQKAGLAQGYLSMIERGLRTPSIGVLAGIARVCGAELVVTLKEKGS